MNLSEALDAALPEIPRNRLSRKNPPRLDPELIIREDVTDGEADRRRLPAKYGQPVTPEADAVATRPALRRSAFLR